MKTKHEPYTISIETIRKANDRLIHRGGYALIERGSYTGEIKINLNRGGIDYSRTITKQELNSAYKKALEKYAEKL